MKDNYITPQRVPLPEVVTLRDYFAGKAMQGAMADPEVVMNSKRIAEWAYSMADAMMEARGNG